MSGALGVTATVAPAGMETVVVPGVLPEPIVPTFTLAAVSVAVSSSVVSLPVLPAAVARCPIEPPPAR